jgi:hypothetical protein
MVIKVFFRFGFFGHHQAVEIGVVDIVVIFFGRGHAIKHAVAVSFRLLDQLSLDYRLNLFTLLCRNFVVNLSKVNLENLVETDVTIAEKVHVIHLFVKILWQRNDHTLRGHSLESNSLDHNDLGIDRVGHDYKPRGFFELREIANAYTLGCSFVAPGEVDTKLSLSIFLK